ncbi:MAG: Transcriptional regulator, MarR family [Ilumatobacteraceae bacterium]|nr:Transcriptional regulator, MarR family [Ilumatobacteraceae bacterium]
MSTYRAGMVAHRSLVADAERSLERLFRLGSNRKMYAKQAAAVGAVVARPGYALLRSIDEAGEISMGDLARECSMDPAAAGRQVRGLEEDGIVERVGGSDDGRVVVVRLTDDGRAVYRRIVDVRTSHLAKVLDEWPEADRRELIRLVDRLVSDLRAVPFKPAPPR